MEDVEDELHPSRLSVCACAALRGVEDDLHGVERGVRGEGGRRCRRCARDAVRGSLIGWQARMPAPRPGPSMLSYSASVPLALQPSLPSSLRVAATA